MAELVDARCEGIKMGRTVEPELTGYPVKLRGLINPVIVSEQTGSSLAETMRKWQKVSFSVEPGVKRILRTKRSSCRFESCLKAH